MVNTCSRILALLLCCAMASVSAQEFPAKPVRLIVAYPPGGASDVVARLVAQEMTGSLHQTVIVDNRPGMGGNIAAAEAARAPKDGYTLFLGDTGTLVMSPAIYSKLQHNPDLDFAPVSMVADSSFLLVVHKDFPAKTLAEFIAYAKARPGSLSYASPGNGSPHHVAMELIKTKTGLDIAHVPYRGAAPATTDLISGQVPMMILDPAATIANIRGGKIRALATLTTKRLPALPDVPTAEEAGVQGIEASSLWALMVPAGTPMPVVRVLADAVRKATRVPGVVQKITDMGLTPIASTPEELTLRLAQESRTTRQAVRRMNISLD